MSRLRTPLFATTLFLSAFLLFICQPMAGKMLLPYLGGAAAVWTTCVLFFQAMLLAGYVYAHLIARIADIRLQAAAHALLLLVGLTFHRIAFTFDSSASASEHPTVYLLLQLLQGAGVPFFIVSTTAPLLQSWFSRTPDTLARDPYFLYSASNAGSLLALLSYPFFVEPRMGVSAQSELWSLAYRGLIVLLLIVGVSLLSDRREKHRKDDVPAEAVHTKTRAYWIAAAFVPSGLMLAVTTHIASNIGSVPFLWLVPLAIYLLTFIGAFARRFRISSERVSRLIPVLLITIFPLVAASVVAPPGLNWFIIGAHLLLLYCGALLCHTRLAESRPDARHLTQFYFWIALGGVLGGLFTATIAPALFNSVAEYPFLVALLPFFRSGRSEKWKFTVPVVFAGAVLAIWIVFRLTGLDSNTEAMAFVHTAILFTGYGLMHRVRTFAMIFAFLTITYALILPRYIEGANRIHAARNFFGVKRVLDDRDASLRKLLHGDTLHGSERTDKPGQPVSYYYPGGSVSDVIEMLRARGGTQRFGVLGLGAGTMAAYADADHKVTFYEIDPAVEPIARNYFTFLSQCSANCDVVIGDGRVKLAEEPKASFDLLLLDAFSSDSIPAHLVTREAVQLYLAKLRDGGILLFHVSNRYLNVEGLVSSLVLDAGLTAYSRLDEAGDLRKEGKSSADHLVAARRAEDLEWIAGRPGWQRVASPASFKPWTDDYSNLLGLIRWH